jgi:hypothetical protein
MCGGGVGGWGGCKASRWKRGRVGVGAACPMASDVHPRASLLSQRPQDSCKSRRKESSSLFKILASSFSSLGHSQGEGRNHPPPWRSAGRSAAGPLLHSAAFACLLRPVSSQERGERATPSSFLGLCPSAPEEAREGPDLLFTADRH